ncbi:MAG: protein phosphatase 2C domain-containing protein [Clostridiales Family XIII bacterium]|jgi:serine/threonine protein phosphatase PrpC|nr:protein phosphatase 2C domain-containing protein [Clostridiales Family XIII bacterium]
MFGNLWGNNEMQVHFLGKSVTGASHERSGTEGQDCFKIVEEGNVLILAVADGHGSKYAEFSKDGSQIAVDVFCRIMSDYARKYRIDKFSDSLLKEKIGAITDGVLTAFKKDKKYSPATDELISFLNRDGQTKIAQTITNEWKEEVHRKHKSEMRHDCLHDDGSIDWSLLLKKYGSTLLGLVIAEDFVFAFQLGDGDAVRIDDNKIESVVVTDKILGVETHSIGRVDSWKNAKTKVLRLKKSENRPYAYFLTTDGFANSYPSQREYDNAIREYFNNIKEHGFEAVESNLTDWLVETSKMGCGDDTTMVVAYFADEKVLENNE